MEKQKIRTSTFSSPSDYALPRVVSSETIIKSAFTNNSHSSIRNKTSIIQKTNEAIRELICLGFYARNNLNSVGNFLGKYEFNEKEYDIYLSSHGDSSIFIQCGNESLFLMVEDKQYREYLNGPLITDVILRVNRYKNVGINDIPTFDIDSIPTANVANKSKILLNYLYSSFLYHNPNEIYQDELEEKRYTFCEPEIFDMFLIKEKFQSKMDGVFNPEIIIDIINQIYLNFKQIYINNKINGIISSLTQEELLTLKEKIQEQSGPTLTKKLTPPKNTENK